MPEMTKADIEAAVEFFGSYADLPYMLLDAIQQADARMARAEADARAEKAKRDRLARHRISANGAVLRGVMVKRPDGSIQTLYECISVNCNARFETVTDLNIHDEEKHRG